MVVDTLQGAVDVPLEAQLEVTTTTEPATTMTPSATSQAEKKVAWYASPPEDKGDTQPTLGEKLQEEYVKEMAYKPETQDNVSDSKDTAVTGENTIRVTKTPISAPKNTNAEPQAAALEATAISSTIKPETSAPEPNPTIKPETSAPEPNPTINLSTFAEDLKASFGNFVKDNVDEKLEENLAPYYLQWTGLSLIPDKAIGDNAIDLMVKKMGISEAVDPYLLETFKNEVGERMGKELRGVYNEENKIAQFAETFMAPLRDAVTGTQTATKDSTAMHTDDTASHDAGTHMHGAHKHIAHAVHYLRGKSFAVDENDPRFAGLSDAEIEAMLDLFKAMDADEKYFDKLQEKTGKKGADAMFAHITKKTNTDNIA
jgi:hypothetical protein